MARTWTGEAPRFDLPWAGRTWTLRLDAARPGLYLGADSDDRPVLALAGLAGRGRIATRALGAATLDTLERRAGRVEATFAPLGWGRLRVRAAWQPHGEDAVDLEIQAIARSVEPIPSLEVLIGDAWEDGAAGSPAVVEPRDRRSALLTYDGRELGLDGLSSAPVGDGRSLSPSLIPAAAPGQSLLILADAGDVSRRVARGAGVPGYALFGHDLERGVALRARLRAILIEESEATPARIEAEAERFRGEPLPLGP